VSSRVPTVNLARIVYGAEAPSLDDLAENLHEATKLNSSLSALELRGAALLERHEELRWSAMRSVKEADGWKPVELPPAGSLPAALEHVLRSRRSAARFGPQALGIEQLATLLWAAYGVNEPAPADGPPWPDLRTVPSGGALYPLELYVLALDVDGLAPGVYHYDPRRHRLDELCRADLGETLPPMLTAPELGESAAAVIAITGVFWRSRFKYGLRGYRFTLLEAGHLAQNLLLAATALEVAACP
jgi:SagB-type dehydrogenase family enzyme